MKLVNSMYRSIYSEWREFALKVRDLEDSFRQACLRGNFVGKGAERRKVMDNIHKLRDEVEEYRELSWVEESSVITTTKTLQSLI